MSLPELLEVVSALQKEEKLTLLHTLLNEVTHEEAQLARYFPPGAALHCGWQITTDEAGMRAIQEMLAGMKDRG